MRFVLSCSMVVYSKTCPQVTGDGVHPLRELARGALSAEQLMEIADDIEGAELDTVPPAGERRILNWRHNLDSGAAPVLLTNGAAREACIALAVKAAQALRIRFASIDVVHADSAWQILEVNSGVKMEALGKRHPELVETVYTAALDEVFA